MPPRRRSPAADHRAPAWAPLQLSPGEGRPRRVDAGQSVEDLDFRSLSTSIESPLTARSVETRSLRPRRPTTRQRSRGGCPVRVTNSGWWRDASRAERRMLRQLQMPCLLCQTTLALLPQVPGSSRARGSTSARRSTESPYVNIRSLRLPTRRWDQSTAPPSPKSSHSSPTAACTSMAFPEPCASPPGPSARFG